MNDDAVGTDHSEIVLYVAVSPLVQKSYVNKQLITNWEEYSVLIWYIFQFCTHNHLNENKNKIENNCFEYPLVSV
jgi:hypothetical protein